MLRWTQTGRGTHFLWLPIPASAAVPLLLWFLHMRWWTFFLLIGVCIALTILRATGRTATWVFRRMQCRISGDVIYARPVWYRRRMQRTNSFDLMDLNEIKNTQN